ncbi:8303_t:CDS:2 [Cetraspora pellucida]|uniref:8303_t:CDS:1 n=1 Tax=Cetraspora pellucida TaxID=1433469 RepID=A0ACA9K4Q0_9GLOM|nr:8303_t:CDS:2 [Cetraspora pellucida]
MRNSKQKSKPQTPTFRKQELSSSLASAASTLESNISNQTTFGGRQLSTVYYDEDIGEDNNRDIGKDDDRDIGKVDNRDIGEDDDRDIVSEKDSSEDNVDISNEDDIDICNEDDIDIGNKYDINISNEDDRDISKKDKNLKSLPIALRKLCCKQHKKKVE